MAARKVLIVDDSPTMRGLIRAALATDPRLHVVGEAADPYQAREAIKALDPDVITLDVEMPKMSGLEFLSRLMRLRPMPVVMVSVLTSGQSDAAIKALSLGAVDCVGKPTSDPNAPSFSTLSDRVYTAANANVRDRVECAGDLAHGRFNWNGKILLIGASTGGVDALQQLLRGFPANCPPTLITQHMPEHFLSSFAVRLDSLVAPKVELADTRNKLAQGSVLIAPGGEQHLAIDPTGSACRLEAGEKVSGHRPSVDVLFSSAVAHAPKCVAFIMTGMGRDGADGMLKLRQCGVKTFGQDKETSLVYGMPRVAAEIGAVEHVVSLDDAAKAILSACGSSATSVHG